jgi:single-strand DNA-binding protein
MASLNKVYLMGNLTRDPELRYTPSGTAVASFGIAVNRTWTGQNSEKKEEVCFVDINAFGRRAEVINEYFSKGNPIFIEGRLQFNQWETKEGQKRSILRVVAENFQFIGSGSGKGGGAGASHEADESGQSSGGLPDLNGEEIPF